MPYESNNHLDDVLFDAAVIGIATKAAEMGCDMDDPATSERMAHACARVAMRLAEDAGQEGPDLLRAVATAREIALRLNHGVEI